MQSSGKAGVIIFSLGSYVNSMDTELANLLADAFAKLPQKVVWKLAGEPPSKIPLNVKILKWLPQNDLLGELFHHLIISEHICFIGKYNYKPEQIWLHFWHNIPLYR